MNAKTLRLIADLLKDDPTLLADVLGLLADPRVMNILVRVAEALAKRQP